MALSISKIYDNIIHELEANSRPEAIEEMSKYGITPGKAYGVSIPVLQKMAKGLGKKSPTCIKTLENEHPGNPDTCKHGG